MENFEMKSKEDLDTTILALKLYKICVLEEFYFPLCIYYELLNYNRTKTLKEPELIVLQENYKSLLEIILQLKKLISNFDKKRTSY